jgi:hypothetical protein
MTTTWALSTVVGDNGIDTTKNAGRVLVILITMQLQRYNAGCITQ